MKTICTLPVRNEAWILGLSVRALLEWCDEVVILDHCSTDGSREIERELESIFPGRVSLIMENDPVWYECRHRQAMLDLARARGASHIVTVDADEVLTSNLLPSIRATIIGAPAAQVLQLPWVCLARGMDRFYSAGRWYNNWVSTSFLDTPASHWKARDGYDFHHRHPMGRPAIFYRPVQQAIGNHGGGLMHLQFVDARRLKAKQYLYQLTERLRWPKRESVSTVRERYQPAVYESDPANIQTQPADPSWWSGYGDAIWHYYRPEIEPWQLEEIARTVRENPGIENGLDDFGLLAEMGVASR